MPSQDVADVDRADVGGADLAADHLRDPRQDEEVEARRLRPLLRPVDQPATGRRDGEDDDVDLAVSGHLGELLAVAERPARR